MPRDTEGGTVQTATHGHTELLLNCTRGIVRIYYVNVSDNRGADVPRRESAASVSQRQSQRATICGLIRRRLRHNGTLPARLFAATSGPRRPASAQRHHQVSVVERQRHRQTGSALAVGVRSAAASAARPESAELRLLGRLAEATV